MKKKLNIIVVCLLCLLMAAPVLANMRIELNNGIYGNTNGGEFLITVLDSVNGGGDKIGIYDVGDPPFETFFVSKRMSSSGTVTSTT